MNTNVSNFFQSRATDKMKLGTFAQEFSGLIIASVTLKFIANLASMYLAYQFVYDLFSNYIFNRFAVIGLTLLILAFIEVAVSILLFKSLKFFFRGVWNYAIFSFVGFALVFSLSAVTSLQGVETIHTAKLDKTHNVDSLVQIRETSERETMQADTARINEQIRVIQKNPTVWTGSGKRDGLSVEQLEDIQELKQKEQTVLNDYRLIVPGKVAQYATELESENDSTIKVETKKPLVFTWIILGVQFVATLFLVFAYYQTVIDTNLPDHIKANLKVQSDQAIQNVVQTATQTVSDIFAVITNSVVANRETAIKMLAGTAPGQTPTPKTDTPTPNADTPTHTPTPNAPTPKTPRSKERKVGFDINARIRPYTPESENEESKQVEQIAVTSKNLGVFTCRNCGQTHPKNAYNQIFCSNNDKCRLEYYEKKTGKNIDRIKNKIKHL